MFGDCWNQQRPAKSWNASSPRICCKMFPAPSHGLKGLMASMAKKRMSVRRWAMVLLMEKKQANHLECMKPCKHNVNTWKLSTYQVVAGFLPSTVLYLQAPKVVNFRIIFQWYFVCVLSLRFWSTVVIEGSLNSKLPTIWRVEKQMKSR